MTTSIYREFRIVGMAVDPIHVGTGGARLGRVDLTIVRDPVTQIPKIPGSSMAGVYRSYAAMHLEVQRAGRNPPQRQRPYFPDCAGQGQADRQGQGGHCGQSDCPICVCYGFARGQAGGFAGLAAFSDAHVLLFPVATRKGPMWVTSPSALMGAGIELGNNGPASDDDRVYHKDGQGTRLNLGWLMLEGGELPDGDIDSSLEKFHVPVYIREHVALVSDKLFAHVVNSNLEVRTSISIDPGTGAAEEGALFTYEALPRTTILAWTVTCRSPRHFKIGNKDIEAHINGTKIADAQHVLSVVETAHPYLEHLGIGGMGTRGMGRLRVLGHCDGSAQVSTGQAGCATDARAQDLAAQSK